MTRTLVVSNALLLWAAAVGVQPAYSQQSPGDGIRVAVNRVFAPWSATDGPGCAVGVGDRGQVAFQNGYGLANLELDVPITPTSIFHVASVSKQFTAAAIMLLAIDGALSLDDDIRTYLPEIPEYDHPITIRHLLTHTSGLRDQWDFLWMARGRFEQSRITEADVLEIAARQRDLNFMPGAEYLYSNTGYTLAGTIVRRVSGKTLRDFADERIFRPLGMKDTHFHDDYTMVVKGRAAGYAPRPDGGWRVSLPNYDTYGATSLFTTVGDLLKWTANFSEPTLGGEHLVDAMLAAVTLTNGDTTGYGLGVRTGVYRGTMLLGHGGADAGYRAYVGWLPEHGLSVAVLCNAASAVPGALAREVVDVFRGSYLEPPDEPEHVAVSLTAEELARVVGVYADPATGAPLFISLRSDTLVLGRTTGPILIPLSDRRFRISGQPVELEVAPNGDLIRKVIAWPPGTPIRFERRQSGSLSSVELERYTGSYYSEELGATYTITATNTELVLNTRWGEESTVQSAYSHTFSSVGLSPGGGLMITFTIGSGGQIDGMLMSTGRVRGVRFA